jgi:hypothetical protein
MLCLLRREVVWSTRGTSQRTCRRKRWVRQEMRSHTPLLSGSRSLPLLAGLPVCAQHRLVRVRIRCRCCRRRHCRAPCSFVPPATPPSPPRALAHTPRRSQPCSQALSLLPGARSRSPVSICCCALTGARSCSIGSCTWLFSSESVSKAPFARDFGCLHSLVPVSITLSILVFKYSLTYNVYAYSL